MDGNLGQPKSLNLSPHSPTLWCVGRNYLDHAQEMNQNVPKEPLIFLKAGACLSQEKQVQLPAFSQEVHHEIELAVQLDNTLQPCLVALALDLTARDAQSEAKEKGLPWTLAKSFSHSCPISSGFAYQGDKWFSELEFSLRVNGELRQKGRSQQMIFSLPTLLTYLKSRFPIRPGDIILTGTPSGVAALKNGDQACAELGGFKWFVDFVDANPTSAIADK